MLRLRLLSFLPFIAFQPVIASPPMADRSANEIIVVAHRGLVAGVPENTLAAYRRAIDLGVDAIEIDLRATADGQLVIMHDPTVDRTTNGRGRIVDLSLSQIRSLDAGHGQYAGEPVPTFVEVLELVRGKPVQLLLDLKATGKLNLPDIVRLIGEHGVDDQLIMGVRSLRDLKQIKALAPRLRTLAFISRQADMNAFIDAGVDIIRLWSDWVLPAARVGDARETAVGAALVRSVHARGKKVWAVIGKSHASPRSQLRSLHEQLVQSGVEAIVTDNPELILKVR